MTFHHLTNSLKKMKSLPVIALAVASLLTVSCKDKAQENVNSNPVEENPDMVTMSREELEATLMTRTP